MKLSRAAAGVSFFGALAIGMAAALITAGGETEAETLTGPGSVNVTYSLRELPATEPVAVTALDLEGVWTGTWDHTQVPCTITINRVDGNRFHGILTQGEAKIAFEGTFHADNRRVFFRETKIAELGMFSEWSLGTNSGEFSFDGRTLSGTGIDRWGTYRWSVSKN